jgi:hypothetical protein
MRWVHGQGEDVYELRATFDGNVTDRGKVQ